MGSIPPAIGMGRVRKHRADHSVISGRVLLGLFVAFALVASACSRGPEPPRPTEDLRPTIVGIVVSTTWVLPATLDDGSVFPPDSATVRRVENWPGGEVHEPDEIREGSLLLAGQDPDGSWWYEIAEGTANPEGCWPIFGGSFDEGTTIWFSSGLRVPKAPDFEIRVPPGSDPARAFPGHTDDLVCVDEQGLGRYFELFEGR